MLHSGRSDVVLEEAAPTQPDLLVHHAVDMMKMDRLERFEKLITRVKKASLFLSRQRLEIFQASSPDSGQVGIFSQRFRYLAE